MEQMGEGSIQLRENSQLVISHIKGETQAKDPFLQRYMRQAREKLEKFKLFKVAHVPRKENTQKNVLSRLASSRGFGVNHSFVQENLKVLSIKTPGRYSNGHKQL